MKRMIALAALLVAASLTVWAQERPGRPGGPGGRGILPMLHELNLTDAQKEQIKSLTQEERQAGPPKSFELEQKLRAAVLAQSPDPQAIEALKTSLNAAHAEELDRRIEHLQKLAEILTPDQKQQLATMKPPEGRGWGRSGR